MQPELFPPNITVSPFKYKHKKDMLGRKGLILHAISEYLHKDGLKWYRGYNEENNTYNNKPLDEYDEWIHCLEFMSLVNLYAHYSINIEGELIVVKNNTNRAPHAGKSEWKELKYLNNWYLGVEIMVEGRNTYGEFIDKINNTNWCNNKQYHCVNFLIEQLKQDDQGCNEIIGHKDCAGDHVRGKGKGKQDPGLGFRYELINGYSGNV